MCTFPGKADLGLLTIILIDCYDALVRKLIGPLQPKDIERILDHFNGPLHQKWLNFLSLLPPRYASPHLCKLRDQTDLPFPMGAGSVETCPQTYRTNSTCNFDFGNVFEFGNAFDFENGFEFWDDLTQSPSLWPSE